MITTAKTLFPYKVTITDEFRTGIDAVTDKINYIQPMPLCELVGVENGGCTNGQVRFVWQDEAKVTVTKDGVLLGYESGDMLTFDGIFSGFML